MTTLSDLLSLSLFFIGASAAAVTLDENGDFKVSWSFSGGKKPTDNITFTIEAATTGWVGLGFSPNGGMSGADIVVAWVDSEGKAFIEDRNRPEDGNGFPVLDDTSDVSLVSASEDNGKTRIVFTRKLNTCDKKGDRGLTNDTTRLIYAYGITDPQNNKFSQADRHSSGRRGAKSVYLLDPDVSQTAKLNSEDVKSFDVVKENYTVPDSRTTYHCSIHKVPQLDKKHHIISTEPVITPGNEGLVHHIIVYACWNLTDEGFSNLNLTESVCYENKMPESFQICRAVMFGWAVGGQIQYMPEEAGFAIGTGDMESSPLYMLLEIHYDNPDKESGKLDSSGLRLYYTPNVRQYDLGSLFLGTVNGIIVPPKQESFQVVGYCDGTCTNNWIPDEGVTAVSYFLHAHLLGAGIQVDWYRDGKPVGILASDKNYDFNFQENRLLPEKKKILPGDSFKVTCNMKSSNRAVMTFGGEATSEEMCLAFIIYYPRQPITSCQSMPSFLVNPADPFYNELDLEFQGYPDGGYMADLLAVFENLTWTDDKVERLQDLMHASSHMDICMINGNQFHPNPFQIFSGKKYEKLLSADDNDICVLDDVNAAHQNNVGYTLLLAATVLTCSILSI